MFDYDVIVIGSGPGGYVCAIKAAQLGLRVACIEEREVVGGTCLNEGCIPSKVLLHSSGLFYEAKYNFENHGVKIDRIGVDLNKMMSRKEKIVSDLNSGIKYLFKANKIELIKGRGTICGDNKVIINNNSKESLLTKYIVIATGSTSKTIPCVKVDEKDILSSTGALDLNAIPKRMAVIGGGVIGLELGSIWSRLGSKVIILEYSDKIIPTMDADISILTQKLLVKQGMEFKLSTKVESVEKVGNSIIIKYNEGEVLEVDKALVAIGRKPNTEKLGVELERNQHGFILVNKKFETNLPGVFAIGDVIPGPMLAHKAEKEGIAVAEIIACQSAHIGFIPSVIYTHPEAASVGYTEQEVKGMNIKYKVGKFPFTANSRAKATGETDGFVKIIVDKDDTIIGAHIIGPQAGTLINELVLAMEYGASAEDISMVCHSHPDFNEAINEAALAACFKAIHSV